MSQAHIRKMPCPELRGVFICHQIFIEQLLPARHSGKIKVGMRLIASPPLSSPPPPRLIHRPLSLGGLPLTPPLLLQQGALPFSQQPHTSRCPIPVNLLQCKASGTGTGCLVPGLRVGTNEVLSKYFCFMSETPKASRSEPDRFPNSKMAPELTRTRNTKY